MSRISIETKRLRAKKLKEGLYWCSKCEEFLFAKKFYRSSYRSTGLSCYCRTCHKIKQRIYQPKIKRRKDGTYWSTVTHRRRKKKAINMAGGCCQKCGYNEFSPSLCFHHVNPDNKELKHLSFSVRLETVLGELDKCVLLCQNCHFAFHASEWNAEFINRDELGWTIRQYTIPKV